MRRKQRGSEHYLGHGEQPGRVLWPQKPQPARGSERRSAAEHPERNVVMIEGVRGGHGDGQSWITSDFIGFGK